MTDKEKLEKVIAEIERVKKNQEGVFTAYTDGKFDLCEHLLSFVDSMQEEPVNNDFEMALAEMISKAQTSVIEPLVIAAQWKDELIKLAKGKEPVSDDFKEFEVEYLEREKDNIVFVYDRHAGLVDGAKWQKQQMMKDADDYIVDDDNTIKRFYDTGGVVGKPIIFGSTPDSINVGDHVKVIVIKED